MANEQMTRVHEVIQSAEALLHAHIPGGQQRLVFPYVRYTSILGRPQLITSDNIPITGAPFHILSTDSIKMSVADVRALCGDII